MNSLLELLFENHKDASEIVYKTNEGTGSCQFDRLIFEFLSAPFSNWAKLQPLIFDHVSDEDTEFYMNQYSCVPALQSFIIPLISQYKYFMLRYRNASLEETEAPVVLLKRQMLSSFIGEFRVDRWKMCLKEYLDDFIGDESFCDLRDGKPPVLRLLFHDVKPGYSERDRCDFCFPMYEKEGNSRGESKMPVYLNKVIPNCFANASPEVSTDEIYSTLNIHEGIDPVTKNGNSRFKEQR